ncbi:MAG TPA: Fe-S cluster assembly protein SufD [Acidimicrobiales bacterium]|nr:Fe-S cluster assembly protein SufD [Acidimicrobiales bacterium]
MPGLSVDAARALDGPDWLRARRERAAEQAAAADLPSTEEEIWRYSRIEELDLDRFRPAPDEVSIEVHRGDPRVTVRPAADVDERRLGSAEGPAPDVFAAWNDALSQPYVVHVPAGVTLTEPIVVTHRVHGDGAAAFPRLLVDAGPDSEATVVERFASDDVAALVVPLVELRAAPAARLRYVAVNDLGPKAWQIGHQLARGERDSNTLIASVALGGDYARVRSESRLDGPGAEARQIAVYFGEAHQMHDFRTLQDHVAPKTTSNLLFKGAVQGRARSVYTGLIHIGPEAKGANAFQTNRNLKLSDGAWAESVPNLDIETNDVRCSHASAVGPVDEDQRFYLESRGVPPGVAERLIVLGFFDEVLTQLPVPGLAAEMRDQVAAKLDRRDG